MNYLKKILLPIFCLLLVIGCGEDDNQPMASCTDGIQNGNEVGIDCGGDCSPCISCDDGIQNGDEEGIDCGASCGVLCPIVIDCEGEELCMQAIVGGFFWGALEVQVVHDNLGLSIVGNNFDFVPANLQDGHRRAEISLFFPNPEEHDLPYSITINDEASELVSLGIIINGLFGDTFLRDYKDIVFAKIVLTTFDTTTQTATGEFSVRGKTISEFETMSEVEEAAWNGQFSVSW